MEEELGRLIPQYGVLGGALITLIWWLTRSLIPSLQKQQEETQSRFLSSLEKIELGCTEVQKGAIEVIKANTNVLGRVEKALDLQGGDLKHGSESK